jgi:hypothetical protein
MSVELKRYIDPEQSTTIFRIRGKRGGKPIGFSGMPLFLKTDASPGEKGTELTTFW